MPVACYSYVCCLFIFCLYYSGACSDCAGLLAIEVACVVPVGACCFLCVLSIITIPITGFPALDPTPAPTTGKRRAPTPIIPIAVTVSLYYASCGFLSFLVPMACVPVAGSYNLFIMYAGCGFGFPLPYSFCLR